MKADTAGLAEALEALLPQTQCGRCGYPGCAPYARALVAGEADIDRCPPGGQATVAALARLLGRAPLPLDPARGPPPPPQVAWIDESVCIGCARCLPACPVDAILGAPRRLHTVLAAHCTGCELCLPPCPVDCIELRALPVAQAPEPVSPAALARARLSRDRHQARQARLARGADVRERAAAQGRRPSGEERRRLIAEAVARVQARRQGGS